SRTACSTPGSSAAIRSSISRNGCTGLGRSTACCATRARCCSPVKTSVGSPRVRSGCTARTSASSAMELHRPVAGRKRSGRAFLARFPELAGRRLVLYLGRMHPKKGADLLIDAFAAVASRDPSLDLVMAGPGDPGWMEELRLRAEGHGLGRRVVWTGMLLREL